MGLFAFLNHLCNFLLPALWLAGVLTWAAHFLMPKVPQSYSLYRQFAINFVVCALVLLLGLLLFGRDGKMATYSAMALACATSQWWLGRSGSVT